jgi:hypothetical protein
MVKIYTLADPTSNEIRYIGKTKRTLKDRWYQHCSIHKQQKQTNYKSNWLLTILNKGLRPKIELLEGVEDEFWQETEKFWIAQFRIWGFRLTNLSEGGQGPTSCKGSSGYKHTEEAKKRISIANSKPRHKEWVINSANANKKPISQFDRNKVFIRDWDSASDAARFLGNIDMKKNISTCCKGNKKSAYGYVWKFKT